MESERGLDGKREEWVLVMENENWEEWDDGELAGAV